MMGSSMNDQPCVAIDPGPTESTLVVWNGRAVTLTMELSSDGLRRWLGVRSRAASPPGVLRIERLACYGMAVGAEVFETAYVIGRLWEVWEREGGRVELIGRRAVKQYWCRSDRARDSNIRQAILDAFGGKDTALGRKAAPGPLHGVSGHAWQALALALLPEDPSPCR